MADDVRFLPLDLLQEMLWTAFTNEQRAELDDDFRWRMARLVENAFQRGHHEGYMRARQEASAAQSVETRTAARTLGGPAAIEALPVGSVLVRLNPAGVALDVALRDGEDDAPWSINGDPTTRRSSPAIIDLAKKAGQPWRLLHRPAGGDPR